MIEIIKRKKHREKFDERKVYASVYAACLVAHMDEKKSEDIANWATKKINADLKKQKIVKSSDLAKLAIKHLKKKSRSAAFLYETHRDIS